MKYGSAFFDGIGFHYVWRIGGAAIGLLYCAFAFQAALEEDRFGVGVSCFLAALYFVGAAKSHALVKAHQRKQRGG